ncbi:MAG: FeoA family protein [Anaerolineales bacterium]|nr:FeoA family protein [Anaerolineales bacterium]
MNLTDVELFVAVKFILENNPALSSRLMRFGLHPGDVARVIRHAPLGGPLLIEVNGREIALSREIAEKILVEIQ